MSEALHEPLTDWIGEHVEKQDGDFRRCCLCGTDGLILERHNHVHLLADEFPRGPLSGTFIWQVTKVPAQIFALFIPQLLQAFSQSMQGRRNVVETYVK
ncbi:MAG: hypothetical protein AUH77_09590 [Candidatus Rokubacteria bacterium 13_1_40CM_4_69_39]|nr:MAG: hypothetical protein AUH77_09590 [Candidatus Rokubacteria bacterium 13_1_40CM_4_69_39]